MAALITLLIFGQAFGAAFGAALAVWSEIAYVRAMRDGKIDTAEQEHMRHIGRGLRFGMSILLLSSLGLVIVAYQQSYATPPAITSSYWMLMLLAILILGGSWALARRVLSFAIGSGVLFASWWFLVYLTFGLLPALSFGAMAAFFAVATVIFIVLLQGGRALAIPRT